MADARGTSPDERDLAALLARLFPQLGELEAPILDDAGLSMWEYAILSVLASGAVVSQTELSERTRRDPTRLGRHLDDLADRGLVARGRSADQRQRTVQLTDEGRAVQSTAKSAIRAAEDEFLGARLSTAESRSLRTLLARLAADAPGL